MLSAMNQIIVFAVAGFATVSCHDESESSRMFLARDSAGIRIVEHGGSSGGDVWELGIAPVVSIGSIDGDDALFRVAGAHRMSDGVIVVANNGTRELKYFDVRGRLIGKAAGQGAGPGEFQEMAFTVSCGVDSVYVWDSRLARLSVFSVNGEYIRAVTIRMPDGSTPSGTGTCDDGMLLMRREHTPVLQEGPYRNRMDLVVFDLDGNLLHNVGDFSGSERYYVVDPPSILDRPLGKITLHAVGGRRVYVGTADNYELRVLTLDGRTRRLIRMNRTDLSITQTHLDRYIAAEVDRVGSDERRRRNEERFWRNLTYPGTFPAFGNLLLDSQGNVWLRDFERPGDTVRTWIVLASSGEQLASLVVPRELRVYEVGVDYVLGRTRDDLGVERVRLYELVKPSD